MYSPCVEPTKMPRCDGKVNMLLDPENILRIKHYFAEFVMIETVTIFLVLEKLEAIRLTFKQVPQTAEKYEQ